MAVRQRTDKRLLGLASMPSALFRQRRICQHALVPVCWWSLAWAGMAEVFLDRKSLA